MPEKENIIVYCDGACSNNQCKTNAGGWGAILKHGDNIKEIHGGELNTTNQRMEITACIRALEHVKSTAYTINVHTDSAYLSNCINQKWYINWQRNGWKNANKKPVENRDLWENLLALLSKFKVNFIKVTGHAGDELNERADELARLGVSEVKQ
ncbi:MAG: ribonuclease HI [Dehalococcoidia bacterium]|nr:MAG: ribonuclease HI [Dehalococcoidia bacterium]